MTGRLRRITTGGQYVAEVDGVRFIAIAMVVLHHVNERVFRRTFREYPWLFRSTFLRLFLTGQLGVVIFFALSGFVLYQVLQRRAEKPTEHSLRKYYARRLTRLEPPYALVMIGIFVFLSISGYTSDFAFSSEGGPKHLWQSLLGSLTYTYDFIWGTLPKLNPPTWSLAIEVQFYVLAPLLTYAALRWGRSARVRLTTYLVVMIAWCFFAGTTIHFNKHLDESLLRYFSYFMAGFAAAEWGKAFSAEFLTRWTRAFDAVAIALFVALPWTWLFRPHWWSDVIVVTTSFAILIAAFHGTYVKRFCSIGWIATIGGMCYTIYLIHLPLLEFASGFTIKFGEGLPYYALYSLQFVMLMCVVAPVSVVFYVLIERPCMRSDWPTRLRDRVLSRSRS